MGMIAHNNIRAPIHHFLGQRSDRGIDPEGIFGSPVDMDHNKVSLLPGLLDLLPDPVLLRCKDHDTIRTGRHTAVGNLGIAQKSHFNAVLFDNPDPVRVFL